MTTPLVTRVLLADDHPVVRNGLRELLNSEPDFRVVGEVDDGAQAVERALADDVDLVILDVTMPRMTARAGGARARVPQARAADPHALDARERAVPLSRSAARGTKKPSCLQHH